MMLFPLRGLRWWEIVLALSPFLLAVSQVGYFASKPFHATFGVILGLLVGAVGFAVNLRLAHRFSHPGLKVSLLLAVLLGCFALIEGIALALGAVLPQGFFDR